MKVRSIIKPIYQHTLLEVIDTNCIRLFYGEVKDIGKETWEILNHQDVREVNAFLAEVDSSTFVPAIQITVQRIDL